MSPVFTEDRPHEGSYVVYFNGVEVPTQSAQVQMGVSVIPQASIAMAPDRELQRLGAEDRVQVAIFYLDDYYTEMSGVDPDFRLLFEGDIVGWQYTNSARGRSLQFKVVNYLKILDELYVSFVQGLDTLVTNAYEAAKGQTSIDSVNFGPTFPVSLLYRGLDADMKKLIRRPYDLVENALRSCTGSLEQNRLGSVAATNFFARYIRRTGFIDRFVPSPLLEIDHMRLDDETDPEGVFPLLRYIRQQDTLDLFKTNMNQMANSSVWNIIGDLFSRMYYEVLPITTAPIAQVNLTGPGVRGDILGPPVFSEAAKKTDQLEALAEATLKQDFNGILNAASGAVTPAKPNRILNYITKPQWLFGIPPACNVLFPSMYTQFTYNEDYDAQPTRMYMNNNWVVNSFQKNSPLTAFAIPHAGYPRQVQRELDKRYKIRNQGDETVSGKNFLVWPEEYFKGPRVMEQNLPDWFMMLFQNANRKTDYVVKIPPIEVDDLLEKMGWPVSREDGQLLQGAVDDEEQSIFLPEDREPTAEEVLDAKKQKLAWLQRVYARYEYYRQRATARNGAVDMLFNPYVLPGFPLVVFDELATGNHVFGYAVSVTHNLSSTSMNTSVSFSLAQTLDEYLHQVLEARTGANPELRKYDVSVAPVNPVPEVRAITQVFGQAEEYFTTLLHQRQQYSSGAVKTAAFDLYAAIKLVLPSGQTVGVDDDRELLFKEYLDKYVDVIPTSEYDAMFKQAQAAMRFVCRPICTLEEYINFQEKGIRKGKISTTNPNQAKGAPFYEEILDLVQGPGDPPVLDENNRPQEPIVADTRANWRERLIRYRTKFLFQMHPQEE